MKGRSFSIIKELLQRQDQTVLGHNLASSPENQMVKTSLNLLPYKSKWAQRTKHGVSPKT